MGFNNPLSDGDAWRGTEEPTVNVGRIGTPVNVQGGGSRLLLVNGSLDATDGYTQRIVIPPPANGLTYLGLRIYISVEQDAGYVALYNEDEPYDFYTIVGNNVTNTVAFLGNISEHRFTIPFTGEFPYTLVIQKTNKSSSCQYQVFVDGVSSVEPFPRTDPFITQRFWSDRISLTFANADRIALPASFQPLRLEFVTNTGGSLSSSGFLQITSFGSMIAGDTHDPPWQSFSEGVVVQNPHILTEDSDTVTAYTHLSKNPQIWWPGTGRSGYLVLNTVSGSMYFSLIGIGT